MSAEVRKSSVEINKTLYNGKGQTVCQSDMIVPDTMPDVLKILQVDSVAMVESKIITEGKISVRGTVECCVLYVPENARGVKSVTCPISFTYTENVKDVEENMVFQDRCQVTHIEYQLVNSRKISIKAVVEIESKVIGKVEIECVCGVEGEDAELRDINLRGRNMVVAQSTDISVSETFPMPKNAECILKCDSRIKSKDVKIINNKIVAKGEVDVAVLYWGGEEAECEYAVVPFTEILDAEGIREDQLTEVNYEIKHTRCDIREGEGGKELKFDAVIEVAVTGEENVEFIAVSDVYGTGVGLLPRFSKIQVEELVGRVSTEVSLREIVSTEQNSPDIKKVYCVKTKANVSGYKITESGIKVEGNVECSVIYLTEKEDAMVHTAFYTLPFNGIISGNYDEKCTVNAVAQVGSCEHSVSGNNVELRLTVKICAEVEIPVECEIVTDIEEEAQCPKSRPAMVLYFVQKGDTMWEIAKKYNSRIGEIEKVNKIDGDNLQEGMMLLIPKK